MLIMTKPSNMPAEIVIKSHELPLCCPQPTAQVWNLHPRVYLPIEASGRATCPYCSTRFILVTDE